MLTLESDEGHLLLARLAGGMLFALGTTLFVARHTREPEHRTRIAMGNAACDVALLIVFATSALTGTIGPVGFVVSVMFGVNAGCWVGTRIGATPTAPPS
jgi:phage tail tape-measure protein